MYFFIDTENKPKAYDTLRLKFHGDTFYVYRSDLDHPIEGTTRKFIPYWRGDKNALDMQLLFDVGRLLCVEPTARCRIITSDHGIWNSAYWLRQCGYAVDAAEHTNRLHMSHMPELQLQSLKPHEAYVVSEVTTEVGMYHIEPDLTGIEAYGLDVTESAIKVLFHPESRSQGWFWLVASIILGYLSSLSPTATFVVDRRLISLAQFMCMRGCKVKLLQS